MDRIKLVAITWAVLIATILVAIATMFIWFISLFNPWEIAGVLLAVLIVAAYKLIYLELKRRKERHERWRED